MTIDLFETTKLPISGGVADFGLEPVVGGGTELTIDYSYELNALGRLARRVTDGQLRKGIGGLAEGLRDEAERHAAA